MSTRLAVIVGLVALAPVARAAPAASGLPAPFDGHGLAATDRAAVDEPGEVGLRLDLGYARAPLQLRDADGQLHLIVPDEASVRVGLHVGVWHRLELGLWLPVTVDTYSSFGAQVAPGAAGASTHYDVGSGDLRLFAKVQPVRGRLFGLALVAAAVLASGDQAGFRSDGKWGGELRAVADVSWRWLGLSANLGARLHDTVYARGGYEAGPELTWALAATAAVHARVSLSLEGAGSESLAPAFSTAARTAALFAGVRARPHESLHLYAAVGKSLDPAAARGDDVRVLVGMMWQPFGGRAGGVSDRDGDGVPDDRDLCPTAPEDRDGWQDDDGCPDLDNDGDGIPDARDRCPDEPEDKDGWQDDDGCPDPDNDGDGIPDGEDWCPNGAGPVDNEGCPPPPDEPAARHAPSQPPTGGPPAIAFARDSAALDGRALKGAAELADWMGHHKEAARVRLEGHADAGERHADALSRARAEAVLRLLAERGVDPARLDAVGWGARRPLGRGAANRVVEWIVVDLPTEGR